MKFKFKTREWENLLEGDIEDIFNGNIEYDEILEDEQQIKDLKAAIKLIDGLKRMIFQDKKYLDMMLENTPESFKKQYYDAQDMIKEFSDQSEGQVYSFR